MSIKDINTRLVWACLQIVECHLQDWITPYGVSAWKNPQILKYCDNVYNSDTLFYLLHYHR